MIGYAPRIEQGAVSVSLAQLRAFQFMPEPPEGPFWKIVRAEELVIDDDEIPLISLVDGDLFYAVFKGIRAGDVIETFGQ